MSHSLWDLGNNYYQCGCGQRFDDGMAALGHAFRLNTRALADKIAADPKSSPDLIARSEATAQGAAALSGRDQS